MLAQKLDWVVDISRELKCHTVIQFYIMYELVSFFKNNSTHLSIPVKNWTPSICDHWQASPRHLRHYSMRSFFLNLTIVTRMLWPASEMCSVHQFFISSILWQESPVVFEDRTLCLLHLQMLNQIRWTRICSLRPKGCFLWSILNKLLYCQIQNRPECSIAHLFKIVYNYCLMLSHLGISRKGFLTPIWLSAHGCLFWCFSSLYFTIATFAIYMKHFGQNCFVSKRFCFTEEPTQQDVFSTVSKRIT